ncbi:hypothetical protein [Streptomyces sp. NPDC017940]|uniref:hypothetical protein n=1 Tax=Streptomyces sp. NPDC017940 TaxID=3365017 RepID=UPI00378B7A02
MTDQTTSKTSARDGATATAPELEPDPGRAAATAERARVLAICRSNWEYRGIDDASMREMLAELSAHLEEAAAAGRSAQDVVGPDAKAFAATWARARAPLHRRVLRMAALTPFVLGSLLFLTHLIDRTLTLSIEGPRLAFYAVILAGTVAVEIKRGSLGFKGWLLVGGAGLAFAQIASSLFGDDTFFRVPLWVTLLLMVPGLPYAYVDTRARKAGAAAGAR